MGLLTLTSSEFENKGEIPAKFTCDGDNVSPPLWFRDLPENTESLVLIMDDPDVPKAVRKEQMFDHWVLYDIPPDTKGLAVGDSGGGVEGLNSAGELGYTGPCPPGQHQPSKHRYFFRLYALDTRLDLKEGATKLEVQEAMVSHIVQEAVYVGLYERPTS